MQARQQLARQKLPKVVGDQDRIAAAIRSELLGPLRGAAHSSTSSSAQGAQPQDQQLLLQQLQEPVDAISWEPDEAEAGGAATVALERLHASGQQVAGSPNCDGTQDHSPGVSISEEAAPAPAAVSAVLADAAAGQLDAEPVAGHQSAEQPAEGGKQAQGRADASGREGAVLETNMLESSASKLRAAEEVAEVRPIPMSEPTAAVPELASRLAADVAGSFQQDESTLPTHKPSSHGAGEAEITLLSSQGQEEGGWDADADDFGSKWHRAQEQAADGAEGAAVEALQQGVGEVSEASAGETPAQAEVASAEAVEDGEDSSTAAAAEPLALKLSAEADDGREDGTTAAAAEPLVPELSAEAQEGREESSTDAEGQLTVMEASAGALDGEQEAAAGEAVCPRARCAHGGQHPRSSRCAGAIGA